MDGARWDSALAGELVQALLEEAIHGRRGKPNEKRKQRAKGGARLVAKALKKLIWGD